MKKLSLIIISLFLLLPILTIPAATHAASCDIPQVRVPMYVDPKQGNRTTTFTVTLYWSRITEDRDKNQYKNIVEGELGAVDSRGPVFTTNEVIDLSNGIPDVDTPYTFSGAFIDSATDAQFVFTPGTIGLDADCNMAQVAAGDTNVVHITADEASGSRLPVGAPCDPQFQNEDSAQDFQKCAPFIKCAPDASGKNVCQAPALPTPTPLPPPPPCAGKIDIDGCTSIWSAIGILNTDSFKFIGQLFAVLLSISGGIALLLIIRSGYQLMTSQGNPEKVKEARERLTSVFVGLLFLVLSIVILEVIGVDLLSLPGLSK